MNSHVISRGIPAQRGVPFASARPASRPLCQREVRQQIRAQEKDSEASKPAAEAAANAASTSAALGAAAEGGPNAASPPSASPTNKAAASAAAAEPEAVPKDPKTDATSGPVLSHKIDEAFGTEELMEEMRDKKEFGKRGEIITFLQIVICVLTLFPPMRLQGLVYLAGVVGMVIGGVLCLWSVICLGRSFSPLVTPRRNHALVTTGMYQYMRHPLYAGLLLLAFGLASISHSESRLLLAMLLYAILDYKAQQEEKALVQRYGDEYKEYMDRVSRFAPVL